MHEGGVLHLEDLVAKGLRPLLFDGVLTDEILVDHGDLFFDLFIGYIN